MPQSKPESYSEQDRAEILVQLGACLAVQRTYGKQATDLQAVAKIFFADCAGFSGREVAEAIAQWRKASPEFPTPADIIGLLNPAPKFDKAVYIALKKRKSELSDFGKEAAYIKAYEKQAIDEVEAHLSYVKRPNTNDIGKAVAAIPREKLSPEEVKKTINEWNNRLMGYNDDNA